jgi:hypothetical protein
MVLVVGIMVLAAGIMVPVAGIMAPVAGADLSAVLVMVSDPGI